MFVMVFGRMHVSHSWGLMRFDKGDDNNGVDLHVFSRCVECGRRRRIVWLTFPERCCGIQ